MENSTYLNSCEKIFKYNVKSKGIEITIGTPKAFLIYRWGIMILEHTVSECVPLLLVADGEERRVCRLVPTVSTWFTNNQYTCTILPIYTAYKNRLMAAASLRLNCSREHQFVAVVKNIGAQKSPAEPNPSLSRWSAVDQWDINQKSPAIKGTNT